MKCRSYFENLWYFINEIPTTFVNESERNNMYRGPMVPWYLN